MHPFETAPDVLLIDDVVAVENGSRLVAGDLHGELLRDTGPDEVSDRRSSQIVKELARHSCGPARLSPVPVKGLYFLSVVVEYPRHEVFALLGFDNVSQLAHHDNHSTFGVLGDFRP